MTPAPNPGGWPADIVKLIQDYFAPWGAWKTAWWENEVSDCTPFGGDGLLREIARRLSEFPPVVPPAEVAALVAAAVREDRERCARLVSRMHDYPNSMVVEVIRQEKPDAA